MAFTELSSEGGMFVPQSFVIRWNEAWVCKGMTPGIIGTVIPEWRVRMKKRREWLLFGP
jgi:hypothetical protein